MHKKKSGVDFKSPSAMHLMIFFLLPLSHLDRHSLYLSTLVACPHSTLFLTAYYYCIYCNTAEITFLLLFPFFSFLFFFSLLWINHSWKSRRLATSGLFGCFFYLTFFLRYLHCPLSQIKLPDPTSGSG